MYCKLEPWCYCTGKSMLNLVPIVGLFSDFLSQESSAKSIKLKEREKIFSLNKMSFFFPTRKGTLNP
jgi:hypothetical protein